MTHLVSISIGTAACVLLSMWELSYVSISMVTVLLWSSLTNCQLPVDHHKVTPHPELHPEVSSPSSPGSWGSWGPWGECSRTCGGGVQEQSRPCLPVGVAYPPRQGPHTGRQDPGQAPPTTPSVSLHRGNIGRPGRRRGGIRISPGMYGYGKMPYVMSSERDPSQPLRSPRHSHLAYGHAWSSFGQHQHRKAHQNAHQNAHHNTQQNNHHNAHQNIKQNIHKNGQKNAHQNARHSTSQKAASVPLHQPPSGFRPHAEQYPHRPPVSGEGRVSTPRMSAQSKPYNPLPSTSCSGTSSQYKMCNTKPCPAASRNIRDVQCSSYNNHPFMGRLYEWEPFNEVPGDQLCELNCRAIGYRFYVRQSDRVIDGTPCGHNETTICVAGKCQNPGCDDLLGSGKVTDRCGVCGGDDTACHLVSGLFQHSLTRVGYHKVVEIPQGATKINITEMVRSQNYLALRSRSGRSIINGNWAIDRPGKYDGGGTVFTYRRPNEISSTAGESFLADGPTSEILDVFIIYQQPNPGVLYEYILPSENYAGTVSETEEGNAVNGGGGYDTSGKPSQDTDEQAGGHRYPLHVPENQVPAAKPPHKHREYNWKLAGMSDCSATCGKGSSYTMFSCVHRSTHERVSDNLCYSAAKPSPQEEPCNVQPCPAFWDIGEWSECSKSCGLGLQHRQVLCRQVYANHTLTVHASLCNRRQAPPDNTSPCQLKICSEWQLRSEWSPCSVPCGVGQRSREVRCVSNVGDVVEEAECNLKLRPSDVENCDMGPCAKSWFYTDWTEQCSAECGIGVRSRSVVCLTNHVSSLPLEGCGPERPPEVQACNGGPCESRTEWFAGPWGQCSAECGTGSQQRAVVCLMRSDEGHTEVPLYECSSLDKPLSQQSCLMKACGAKWYHTDWSACSKTCEGGFRVREVRCLADDVTPSETCEQELKPEEKEECNSDPCLPHIDENCQDKYFNCNVVVQARLCVYNYYKMVCCASCTRIAQRQLPVSSYR